MIQIVWFITDAGRDELTKLEAAASAGHQ